MNRRSRIPSYRLHRQSGQGIVTLTNNLGERRDVLLGKFGTPESQAEYTRVLAEWQANGRRFPQVATSASASTLTVNELILAFWQHAEQHYRRPDGTHTAEIDCLRAALRPLRQLYGHTPVKDFGPLALKAVRQRMIESVDERTKRPWCRRSINLHTYRVRSVFKWGVEQELVPATVLHALQAVRGLQKGRSAARESTPVKPVQETFVEAVLPFVTVQVRAMIELQRLTGMRPGEVVLVRAIDLDMSGKVWLPPRQRTGEWHPQDRMAGPRPCYRHRPQGSGDHQAVPQARPIRIPVLAAGQHGVRPGRAPQEPQDPDSG